MKISEAFQIYRGNRAELVGQTRNLVKQRDAAQKKAQMTGSQEDIQLAATLELSIQDTQKKFDANQEVLDRLTQQWCNAVNMESARQLADPETGYAAEMAKLMEVARRIASGARVPQSDERKLMEYSDELYQAAKQAGALVKLRKRKEYDSLWDDEEASEQPNPVEVADNTEVVGDLPEISLESGSVEGQM